jgi:4-hydroxybenzoate polyprenyltransferase
MGVYVELLRIRQWIKNVAVLAVLPFGWLEHGLECGPLMAIAAGVFCVASSAVYSFNDALDYREDLLHPGKRNRPVARGAVSPSTAILFAVVLAFGALALSFLITDRRFTACAGGYLVLMLAYTLFLKHEPILDVIIIACGFVLRTVAGAIAVGVYISPWLVVCTFTLCLFLGFGKRRSEIYALNSADLAAQHRKTLTQYSADLLNQLLSTSAGVALVTFMLYIMGTETLPGQEVVFDKSPLLYTFPLVAYGLFRYAMLIESGKVTGPTDIILKDRILLVVVLLWLATSAAIVLLDPIKDFLAGN